MDHRVSEKILQIDSDLAKYIDKTVTEKVTEKLNAFQEQLDQIKTQCQNAAASQPSNSATLVAFSGDMDKLIAAFIIATGAASMGMEVSVYVTFWALAALKKKTSFKGKPFTDMLTGFMLPSGPGHLNTSKLNMLGIGPAFFGYVMKKKNVASLSELIDLARQMGVRIIACQLAMEVMGIKPEELIDGLDFGGATTYLADARDSKITLFI
jgi:peroxiredoxin family protein